MTSIPAMTSLAGDELQSQPVPGSVVDFAAPPALTPLPLGSVEPTGWLRDWAVTMRNGISSQLDERHPVYRDGWKGIGIESMGSNPDGTGWPLEQSAYWMDGALRLGYLLHDQALIDKVRARLDPVVDGVLKAEEETSFIHWKPGSKPKGFDDWAHSHMARALIALYQASGEKRVLEALVKVYAHYTPDPGSLDYQDVRGICNLDPMMETYACSGDQRILERAKAAIERPEVQSLITEWSEGRFDPGHLVITYENIRIPAVVYPWLNDRRYLKASRSAFEWLDQHHMMPYGLPSGEETVAGVGAGRKTESCDIPAMLLSSNWMYRITGEGPWGDRMEKAFFNAGPAPLSRDCATAAYYQTPNRIQLGHLPVESPNPGAGGISFGPLACGHVLCCIGAVNRIIPYFAANMWMATRDGGLAAALYGPCVVRHRVREGLHVKLASETDYPFGETIRMKIDPDERVVFPLYLRIPAWCRAAEIKVNGKPVEAVTAEDLQGFVRINREWSKGDLVSLRLPMTVEVKRGLEGPYPAKARQYFHQIDDAVFRPRALPYASVHHGPLLFCLPLGEVDENHPVDDADWKCALNLHPDEAARVTVVRKPMPKRWDWPLDAPVSMIVPASPFDWQPDVNQGLPPRPVSSATPKSIRLIPYGCAKFQISMFPVTEHAWTGMPSPGDDREAEAE